MSEAANPDVPSDTQDTFFEESESDSQFTKNLANTSDGLIESQDFHLHDTGDSQEFEADLIEAPDNEIINMNKESEIIEKSENENEQENFGNESLGEQLEEDEDIVRGTPPPLLSPSKKLASIADLKSLKRRADMTDDAENNDLQIKKNKIDEHDNLDIDLESENMMIDSEKQVEKIDDHVIIPETQDSVPDSEQINEKSEKQFDAGINNSLEDECNLVNEAIDSVDDGDENQNDSNVANFADNDISNQNEILADDVNESKDISKEIDFSEDVSFAENGDDEKNEPEISLDNEIQENAEKETETVADIENQIENCEKEVDNVESNISEKVIENQTEIEDGLLEEQEVEVPKVVNEVKSNSIEDALKELGGESDATEASKPQMIEKESTESELLAVLTDSDTNAEVDEGIENKEVLDNKILDDKVIENKEDVVEMETDELSELKSIVQNDQIAKSRMSIEVIYDRSSLSSAKPAEIVEIDDDEEKIILDSSQDDSKVLSELPSELKDDNNHKSDIDDKSNVDFSAKFVSKDELSDKKVECPLTNGDDIKKDDLDTTASLQSNESMDVDLKEKVVKETLNSKSEFGVTNPPLFIISDSEGDSIVENKSTTESNVTSSSVKTAQIEKEFVVCVKLKCLITIDDNTKEILGKEVLGVNCVEQLRNSDTSTSLADISGNDNKDGSPGSVTSATYPRFSIMSTSTVSSSTSSSSAGSLATKNSDRDNLFSVPKGPAKHTKKLIYDDKNHVEFDQLSKEWKNPHLVATSVLNFVSTELSGVDLQNGVGDSIDDAMKKIHSSTPESNKETPQRNSKKGRQPKRLQTRATRKRTKIVAIKTSPNVVDPMMEDSDGTDNSTLKELKTKAILSGSLTPVKKSLEGLRNSGHSGEQTDDLLGKQVFAKWSDNNYYAGKVVDKTKAKYKVSFLDGKSKLLIPDFIIPINDSFGKGLSVYTLAKDGDYGPCGMIVDILGTASKTSYVIEPDEGNKKITVQIKDIFLTPDQAQLLKEEVNSDQKSLPSTPHSISKVTLDNMMEGKRRSKRTGHSPKSKKSLTSLIDKTSEDKPSGSGVAKSKEATNDKDGKTSDSNCSAIEEIGIHGVQKEITGFSNDQVSTKGPQSRIKGKQRNRKKVDDQETIDLLGPIPEPNSKIFEGMSFILTCAALDGLERYNTDPGTDSNSEVGTDNEAEWQSRPFVRDRLEQQLAAGGGKVYDTFDLIPSSEYKDTKLITNVPNLTAKSLLCLSVGISAYNHMWVIRSCQNMKPVNPSEEKLPAGWSIDRRTYVEMFHRRDQKPLTHIIIVIPYKDECDKDFVAFWSRICENAGGTIKVVDNSEITFIEGTVVLTNYRCPTWVIEKAKGWEIPLVSTTWVVQCLIEGKILTYDGHERFMPF